MWAARAGLRLHEFLDKANNSILSILRLPVPRAFHFPNFPARKRPVKITPSAKDRLVPPFQLDGEFSPLAVTAGRGSKTGIQRYGTTP